MNDKSAYFSNLIKYRARVLVFGSFLEVFTFFTSGNHMMSCIMQ
jgi:hypothetical protein